MTISDWTTRWDKLQSACGKHAATGRWRNEESHPLRFEIAAPAAESDLQQVHQQLECSIPTSFARALVEYAAAVHVEWQFPEDYEVPEPFDEIYAGQCIWDLHKLPELQHTYRSWVDGTFSNPDNAYDAVWHNKFAFAEVGNGDLLAIEMGLGQEQPVVYLSHDDGEGHGYWLGADFCDFIDRFTQLGCPGYEDWQWLPFVPAPDHSLIQQAPTRSPGGGGLGSMISRMPN